MFVSTHIGCYTISMLMFFVVLLVILVKAHITLEYSWMFAFKPFLYLEHISNFKLLFVMYDIGFRKKVSS